MAETSQRGMRLQRFLAHGGVAARRKAESLITGGHVSVNGAVITELGSRVDPERDKVFVDGKRILVEKPVHILLNKPKGYVTTATDPEGRPTVMQLIERRSDERLYPVGRLDYTTEGLLLLTNDGDLAFALMHPRHEIEKTYRAKFKGQVDGDTVRRLREGVTLDDGTETRTASVEPIGSTGIHTWIEITIHEGRNRQIHRMAEAVGHSLLKLQRVRYAGLEDKALRLGRWRNLTDEEVHALRVKCGLATARGKAPEGSPGRPAGRVHRGPVVSRGGNAGADPKRRSPSDRAANPKNAASPRFLRASARAVAPVTDAGRPNAGRPSAGARKGAGAGTRARAGAGTRDWEIAPKKSGWHAAPFAREEPRRSKRGRPGARTGGKPATGGRPPTGNRPAKGPR